MLTLTYIVLAVVGCGYVAIALALGQAFDVAGDVDAGIGDAHHGAFHFPFFSPTALATLSGAIGALGLIAQFGFSLPPSRSLLVALPGGVIFTYVVTYVGWRLLATSASTTAFSPVELAGVEAEVLTPIPAGGVGEAAALVKGQRFTASAREEQGLPVPRGAIVTVVRLAGSTLIVRAELVGVREPAPRS
jgi:membrane protein implicated in regulation of membrane protease activity